MIQQIFVCINQRPDDFRPCCGKKESRQLKRDLKNHFGDRIEIKASPCMGYCNQGPTVKIIQDSREIIVTEADIHKIKKEFDD